VDVVFTPRPVTFPALVAWFAGTGRWNDSNGDAIGANNNTLLNFLSTNQPGLWIISGGPNTSIWPATSDFGAIRQAGYQHMDGIGNYAAACAQNDTAHCPWGAGGRAEMFREIDNLANYRPPSQCMAGRYFESNWMYVDEPCVTLNDMTTGLSDNCSIPYNAAGMSILLNYIRNVKHYNIKVGYTLGGHSFDRYLQLFTYAKNHDLLMMDFAQEEQYYSWQTLADTNDWGTFHAAFPNVLRSTLFYSVASYCTAPYADVKNDTIDMIGFWDVDYWAHFQGPMLDPNELAAVESLARTGGKSEACTQTWSWLNADWSIHKAGSASFAVGDTSYGNWGSTWTISSCDYQVWSGRGVVNGLGDPTITQTWPAKPGAWASRACNAPLSVTVGAGKQCNVSGWLTCLVVVRNHNNSPRGLGDSTWTLLSTSF
jgi:hypothetical protein